MRQRSVRGSSMQRLKFDCSHRIDEGHSRIELSREYLTVWNSGGDRRTNCRWAWHPSSSFSVLISGLTYAWLPYSRESSRVESRVECVSSWIATLSCFIRKKYRVRTIPNRFCLSRMMKREEKRKSNRLSWRVVITFASLFRILAIQGSRNLFVRSELWQS